MTFHTLHVDPSSEWRGGQRQIFLLAKGQVSRGLRVTVACPASGELSKRLNENNIQTLDIPPGITLRGIHKVRSFQCSLVAAHSSHAHSIARWVQVPLVVHRRVDFPPRRASKYRRCTVISVSRFVADQLQERSIDSTVVYDGIEFPDELPQMEKSIDLLSIGALVPHKGHGVLAEALRELPSLRAVVLGQGRLRYPELEHHGWVADVRGYFPQAKIYVHPSIDEGLGQSILEAMSYGLPVVASRTGGIPELVDGTGVLVSPGDPSALRQAIIVALEQAEDLGRRSLERSRMFSAERMVEETLRCYRTLL